MTFRTHCLPLFLCLTILCGCSGERPGTRPVQPAQKDSSIEAPPQQVESVGYSVAPPEVDQMGIIGTATVDQLGRLARSATRMEVRLAAVAALGKKGPKGIPGLVSAAHDGIRQTQTAAIHTLLSLGGPSVEPLIGLLDDALVVEGYLDVVSALSAIGEPAIPQLLEAARVSDPNISYGAALALSQIRERVPTLAQTMRQELGEDVFANARNETLKPGPPRILWLTAALRHKDVDVRMIAAGTLQTLRERSKDSAAALAAAMKDLSPEVRLAAESALKQIDPIASAGTVLWIRPRNAAGQTVRLTRAEVYVDYWGGGETIALPQDNRSVRLPLDRTWLCNAWPDKDSVQICRQQSFEARVILEAKGYATVISNEWNWPAGRNFSGAPSVGVDIAFAGGMTTHLEVGDSREIAVVLRKPVPRRIRVIDQNGKGIPGVRVTGQLFLATSNHCGWTEGRNNFHGETNGNGELTVPDANAALSLEFGKRGYALETRDSPQDDRPRLTRVLTEPVTLVRMREIRNQPLQLEFRRNGAPAAGLKFDAFRVNCPGGTCCGAIIQTQTGPDGRVSTPVFYPDEIGEMRLMDSQGKFLWEGTPANLRPSGWTVVNLP